MQQTYFLLESQGIKMIMFVTAYFFFSFCVFPGVSASTRRENVVAILSRFAFWESLILSDVFTENIIFKGYLQRFVLENSYGSSNKKIIRIIQ